MSPIRIPQATPPPSGPKAGRGRSLLLGLAALLAAGGAASLHSGVRAEVGIWTGLARVEEAALRFDRRLERLLARWGGEARVRRSVPRRLGLSGWKLRRARIHLRSAGRREVLAALERAAEGAGLVLRKSSVLSPGGRLLLRAGRAGVRTHLLEFRFGPDDQQERNGRPLPPGGARAAVLIDDIGQEIGPARALLALDIPLSLAILPFLPHSKRIAREARARGREVILHLPMEPTNYPAEEPGPGGLYTHQGPEEWRRRTIAALEAVPGASGVSNHMGSALTRRADAMEVILREVKARNLFFVDSYTTDESVAYDVARRIGLRARRRGVFLDDDPEEKKISARIDRLIARAKAAGSALGIGHPHPATIAALRKSIPRFRAAGVEIVPIRRLLQ